MTRPTFPYSRTSFNSTKNSVNLSTVIYLDLRKASFEEFQDISAKANPVIFVKETDGFGGVGARKLSASDYQAEPSCRALYQELKDNRLFVVEECVVQCEKMNLLCPASINTLRMVTVLAGGSHI